MLVTPHSLQKGMANSGSPPYVTHHWLIVARPHSSLISQLWLAPVHESFLVSSKHFKTISECCRPIAPYCISDAPLTRQQACRYGDPACAPGSLLGQGRWGSTAVKESTPWAPSIASAEGQIRHGEQRVSHESAVLREHGKSRMHACMHARNKGGV